MYIHLPKLTTKGESNQLGKLIRKSMNSTDTTKRLYEKFQAERGAIAAFCREKGITQEWLRLVFTGRFEDLELLIEAADFLVRYKEEKVRNREQKIQVLQEKVHAIN